MKTRDRIVHTALTLFNEQGYGAVTTAMLAAACGISEGNLWYHFKTRQALLEAIGEQFAVAIERRLAMRPADDPAGDYARLLETTMVEFRTYRFLYRDQQAYGEQTDPVRGNSPRWHTMSFDQIEAYLAALVDARLLDWPRERLRDLSINATIILRFGLEHYREMGEPIAEGAGAVRRTLRRHLTLFEHRLDPPTAARLHAAIDAIEAPLLAA
ncbi:MAG: TetR/AcrR family transcriptional regulator [Proteobacteria bacterium]|nr:TetR/AcrR family transcriptional regulator [Pseudomonadota bacterium]